MEKCSFKMASIGVVIILLIGTGVFPTIRVSAENRYKTNLLESEIYPSLETTFWVIGLMQIINKTSDFLEVKNIFGLWISKGSHGGFFESNETLIIYGFNGIASRNFVIGSYENITRP